MLVIFIFLGLIFNSFQFTYKSIIIAFFIIHFHWDIFKECIISYYQKRSLSKNYTLGELEFLTPDDLNNENISVNKILLNFSLNYYLPSLFAFILIKNKTNLLFILFSLTTIFNLKMSTKIYHHFKKYDVYNEDIYYK